MHVLIEFSIENYLSFKEENTFSMVRGKDKSNLPANFVTLPNLRENAILKTAVIYGPNASGKSNFIKAMETFCNYVFDIGLVRGRAIPYYHPFKLDAESQFQPTRFRVVFLELGQRYIYSIAFDEKQVVEETLYYYKTNHISTIFERFLSPEAQPEKKYIQINGYSYYFLQAHRGKFKAIAKNTNDNTLFLTKTRTENEPVTDNVVNWFRKVAVLHDFGTKILDMRFTSTYLLNSSSNKQLIFNALCNADMEMNDVEIDENWYNVLDDDRIMMADEDSTLKSLSTREKLAEPKIIRNKVPFDLMTEESEGTKKLFALIGPMLKIVREGEILFYDEFDVKLHPLICEYLIRLFNNEKNQEAQLIFTTHNTYFLNTDLFRRDQIWFSEKDQDHLDSRMYSLVEYKPRKDKNLENGYLAGRYGAIPFIPSGCIDLWENIIQNSEEQKQSRNLEK